MTQSPDAHARIRSLVDANKVILFMKGNPDAPQCGFSAQVVGVLGRLLPDFASADVLSDPELRTGIKSFSDWPTIPQLYVDGEFVGGCDIVLEMYESGELHETLGLPRPQASPPEIQVSDEAAEVLRAASSESSHAELHLSVDARFHCQLGFGPRKGGEIAVESAGFTFLLDADSASRANGLHIHTTETPQGRQLRISLPGSPVQ